MRVSVVIPCYNSLEFLPRTLESVLAQELPPEVISDFEVILVDDGGSDSLADWVSSRGYAGVRVVRQANAGVSAARNRGIRESTGDVVAFCDSDDLWTPRTAVLLTECFVRDPAIGLAYGFYDVIDAEDAPNGRVIRSDVEGEAWEQLVVHNPVAASGAMVAKAAIEDVGGFSENRDRFRIDVEDWELWIRIASRWRVGLAKEVVAHHRRHGSNSSTDIESLEMAYENLIQVAFSGVSQDRRRLEPHARSRFKTILAWQSLNDREDPAAASKYLAEAIAELPQFRRQGEYWRLRIAIALLGISGQRGYRALRSANGMIRRVRNTL